MSSLIFGLLFLCSFSVVQAQDFKSYTPMSNKTLSNTFDYTQPSEDEELKKKSQDLIYQMDKSLKKPAPVYQVKPPPFRLQQYSEGTGTRGGGSGVLVQKSASIIEVKLLDLFRSENLQRYNQYFPIDPLLLAMENQGTTDQAAKAIFDIVLARVTQVSPTLGKRIYDIYTGDLSLDKWVPVYDDLSLLNDEVAHPDERNQDRIQVASRRATYVMYNTRAYTAMSPIHRAALWMHEYIYALSGDDLSLKTQRAVSLFFSSEFLTIAKDESRIANLFYEMGIISLARPLDRSLPSGTKISQTKQDKRCYRLVEIETLSDQQLMKIHLDVEGTIKSLHLKFDAPELKIFANAVFWAKAHLKTDYPLYKYPAQKIMPDMICFNYFSTKMTQVQLSVAIDEDLSKNVQDEAFAEVELAKSSSYFHRLLEVNPASSREQQLDLINKIQSLSRNLYILRLEGVTKSLTPIEKLMNPKILGSYNIDLEY